MKRRQQKCRWMLGWSNWIAEPKMLHNSPSARRRRVRTSLSTFSNHSHGAVVKQALKMEAEYGRYKIMRKAGHGTYMCVYYIIFIHIINYIYYIFIILYIIYIYIVYIIYYILYISYIIYIYNMLMYQNLIGIYHLRSLTSDTGRWQSDRSTIFVVFDRRKLRM